MVQEKINFEHIEKVVMQHRSDAWDYKIYNFATRSSPGHAVPNGLATLRSSATEYSGMLTSQAVVCQIVQESPL